MFCEMLLCFDLQGHRRPPTQNIPIFEDLGIRINGKKTSKPVLIIKHLSAVTVANVDPCLELWIGGSLNWEEPGLERS